MSTFFTVTVVVPNDILKSSCFITHSSYPTSFSPQLVKQRRPPYYFRILSLSTKQQPRPQGKSAPVTTTTTTSKRKPLATYLIERLGFSEEHSLSISKKLIRQRNYQDVKQGTDLISYENAGNVITFLQEHCGLNHSHIQILITKLPPILAADVDETLRPKVKLLQDLGFSTSDLAHNLSRNPRLFLELDLSPAIQALRDLMGSDEGVVGVFKRLSWGTAAQINNILIPNVTLLENEYGVPRDKIRKFLTSTPKALMRKTEWLQDVLVMVEDKWGITGDSAPFLRAVSVFSSNSDDNINSKCQVFRSYGWLDSDILSLIRRNPSVITLSEARLKKSLEFYMSELGYDPAYLASQPALFSYSLENRVVPRHKILKILKEKGLIKADYKLDTAIKHTDNQFFDRLIRPFKNKVPKLGEVYINGAGGAPTEEPKHLETSDSERDTLVALE